MRPILPTALTLLAGLVLALAPTGAAQAPDPSSAEDAALGLVCGLAAADLPLCPHAPAAIPPEAGEAAHDNGAAVAPPAPAADAGRAVEDVLDDPATAPDRAGDVVASFLALVEDLLGIPLAIVSGGARAVGDALAVAAGAGGAAAGAAAGGADAVTGGVAGAADGVAAAAAAAAGAAATAVDGVAAGLDAFAALFVGDSGAPADAADGTRAGASRGAGNEACVESLCVGKTVGGVVGKIR